MNMSKLRNKLVSTVREILNKGDKDGLIELIALIEDADDVDTLIGEVITDMDLPEVRESNGGYEVEYEGEIYNVVMMYGSDDTQKPKFEEDTPMIVKRAVDI